MTQKVQILLLEDQLLIAQTLIDKLSRIGYSISHAKDGEETFKLMQRTVPDIAILDIEINGRQDGLEIGSYLKRQYRIPIIYLTHYKDDQTFKKAKKTKPDSFLTQPVDFWQLTRAIELSLEKAANTTDRDSRKYLLTDAIYLKCNDHSFQKVALEKIIYLKACGSYTEILTETQKFTFSDNLSYYEKKLRLPLLMRVHRSWMVNIAKVERIKEKNLIIENREIPIGKTYRKSVLSTFNFIS